MANSTNGNTTYGGGLSAAAKVLMLVAFATSAMLTGCSKESAAEKAALKVAQAFYDCNKSEMYKYFEKDATPYIEAFCEICEPRTLNYEYYPENLAKMGMIITDDKAQIPIYVIFPQRDGSFGKEGVNIALVKQGSKWVGDKRMIVEAMAEMRGREESIQRLEKLMKNFE